MYRSGSLFRKPSNRRLLIAFAVAVALHAIVTALLPGAAPRRESQEQVVARISVARMTPTPKPTPSPTPPSRVVSRERAVTTQATPPVVHQPAAPAIGHSAARKGDSRPKPPVFSHVKPIWDLPARGERSGSGSSSGNGTGNGSGGANGNGSGSGGGAQPCGFVEFSDPHGSRYDAGIGAYVVDVSMTVHFPDRHTEVLELDYPWLYPNAASNPWSAQNLDDPNFPTRFQSPPPSKRAAEPRLVQYVIAHSTSAGLTLLKNCP